MPGPWGCLVFSAPGAALAKAVDAEPRGAKVTYPESGPRSAPTQKLLGAGAPGLIRRNRQGWEGAGTLSDSLRSSPGQRFSEGLVPRRLSTCGKVGTDRRRDFVAGCPAHAELVSPQR